MKGVFIILLFLIIGEVVSHFIYGFIPGNIIGMILMFSSLKLGFIKENWIADVCNFLTQHMAIMFLPPSIGIIATYKLLGENIITMLLGTMLTTMLVMAVVGLLMDKFSKNNERNI